MERIANGMWMYRKPKLAEITEKKANSVKRMRAGYRPSASQSDLFKARAVTLIIAAVQQ